MTDYRRAYRPADRRLVGGVSAGLSEHLGVPVIAVRAVFVLTTVVQGVGVLAYLALWKLLPLRSPTAAMGLESASRRGLRSNSSAMSRRDAVQGVAIALVGAGLLVLTELRGVGISAGLLLPLLVIVLLVGLLWRQYDDAALGRWMTQTRGLAFTVRVGIGVVFVGLAAVYVISQERWSTAAMDLLTVALAVLLGVGLIVGPWLYGLVNDLNEERRERVRSQERADVAAHLHDSVLQTLTLLQKNPHDSAQVATLARRQERELRGWLYGDEEQISGGFAQAIRDTAIDVEVTHQIPVEVVVVKDTDMNADLAAVVRAAREAMVNAAKHADVTSFDVYAEVNPDSVEVYIRDRGNGFDPHAVADDRMGVRDSIIGRTERHGGTATIRSDRGYGTEVRLAMPVATRDAIIEDESA